MFKNSIVRPTPHPPTKPAPQPSKFITSFLEQIVVKGPVPLTTLFFEKIHKLPSECEITFL
jgi:hypothetical protein